ncbi:MAG: hypothetical protein ACTSW1_07225 [Candidatus Hodarchaeales archaeon]
MKILDIFGSLKFDNRQSDELKRLSKIAERIKRSLGGPIDVSGWAGSRPTILFEPGADKPFLIRFIHPGKLKANSSLAFWKVQVLFRTPFTHQYGRVKVTKTANGIAEAIRVAKKFLKERD